MEHQSKCNVSPPKNYVNWFKISFTHIENSLNGWSVHAKNSNITVKVDFGEFKIIFYCSLTF